MKRILTDAEKTPRRERLCRAFLSLRTVEECHAFLNDLFTEKEWDILAERWDIARELSRGRTYREASRSVDASTTTVTRVARALHRGAGGYRLILGRLLVGRHNDSSPRER